MPRQIINSKSKSEKSLGRPEKDGAKSNSKLFLKREEATCLILGREDEEQKKYLFKV